MAALVGSSQPFPLRQISLNDLLNAEISSIVTSFSQPHGKMDDVNCSNLILESTIEHKWDLNQSVSGRPTAIDSESTETGTADIQRSTKSSCPDEISEVGGILPNFSALAV
jgi:hypothetical protein